MIQRSFEWTVALTLSCYRNLPCRAQYRRRMLLYKTESSWSDRRCCDRLRLPRNMAVRITTTGTKITTKRSTTDMFRDKRSKIIVEWRTKVSSLGSVVGKCDEDTVEGSLARIPALSEAVVPRSARNSANASAAYTSGRRSNGRIYSRGIASPTPTDQRLVR